MSDEPAFTHGDWVQVYVDPDPAGQGPGYIRIVERYGARGVAILPISGDRLGLVTVYRRLLQRSCLEIPRGFGGEGTGPLSDAVRELHEVTGLVADESSLIPLGALSPNSGLLASEVLLYAAMVPKGGAKTEVVDTDEVTDFDWYGIEEVLGRISSGGIVDAFTLASVLRATLLGLLPAQIKTQA
ncbi:MAG: ADP-ribose pyrophosphatase [Nocardioidaceae bacterium]|jgi:ADP-ribose pyrophosphatase|nr:ADP-ribose pyrophosphatase [Nocardioidaceae bacterium]